MSLYSVLGLDKGATPDEVKSAHRKRVQQTHPDKISGDRETFEKVQHAYLILSDPTKRQKYDATGDETLETEHNPMNDINDVVVNAFDAIYDNLEDEQLAMVDWKKSLENWFKFRLHELATDLAAGTKSKRKLERVLKKLKKREGPDILAGVMGQRLRAHERALDGVNEDIERTKKAREYCKEYDWEKPQAVNQFFQSSTMYTG